MNTESTGIIHKVAKNELAELHIQIDTYKAYKANLIGPAIVKVYKTLVTQFFNHLQEEYNDTKWYLRLRKSPASVFKNGKLIKNVKDINNVKYNISYLEWNFQLYMGHSGSNSNAELRSKFNSLFWLLNRLSGVDDVVDNFKSLAEFLYDQNQKNGGIATNVSTENDSITFSSPSEFKYYNVLMSMAYLKEFGTVMTEMNFDDHGDEIK